MRLVAREYLLLLLPVWIACQSQHGALGFSFQSRRSSPLLPEELAPKTSTRLHISPQQLGTFEALEESTDARMARRVSFLDVCGGGKCVAFEEAWEWQKRIMEGHFQRIVDLSQDNDVTVEESSQFLLPDGDRKTARRGIDTVIMLQHKPVYTLGTGSDEKFIRDQAPDVPTVRMDRGGEVSQC